MRFNERATHESGGPSANRKQSLRWAPLASLALAPLVVLTAPGTASAAQTRCLFENEWNLPGDTTRAVARQQAHNTWEDWVWRGPTYRCPWNVPKCTYAWQQSKTTSWQWSVGLTIGGQSNPATKLAQLTAGYQRSGSTTTAYTFSVDLNPGQYAQPIQVVQRRWRQGDFVGAWRLGGTCRKDGRNLNEYTWDGNHRWGTWQHNIRVNDYGTYHVWK